MFRHSSTRHQKSITNNVQDSIKIRDSWWYSLYHPLQQSWPIVKIAINSNSNSSERSLSNSNTNSNSLEVSLAIAIPIAIVPKMVNSNSQSIAIVMFLLLKRALQGVFVLNMHFYSIWNASRTKKCILSLEKQHFRPDEGQHCDTIVSIEMSIV